MRNNTRQHDSLALEIAKIVFPILLAAGISYLTAVSTAQGKVDTEIAVLRTTEELHFQETQRALKVIQDWIIREEERRREADRAKR